MATIAELAAEDLLLALRPLLRRLCVTVERRAARSSFVHRSGSGHEYVTDDQARGLIADLDRVASETGPPGLLLADAQEAASRALLSRAAEKIGTTLPLDRLAQLAGLDAFERGCVVVCAAPEFDTAYSRAFGYAVDDLGRGQPSVELLLELTGAGATERLALGRKLGPLGALRRHGVLVAQGTPVTELRQELSLAAGVFGFLLGEEVDAGVLFSDPDEVAVPPSPSLPPGVDERRVRRAAAAVRLQRVAVLGIWGGDEPARRRVAIAAAAGAGKPLRTFDLKRGADALDESLRIAAGLGALLWIDTDALLEHELDAAKPIEQALCRTSVPLCLTGGDAWRPSTLLGARPYCEVQLEAYSFAARRQLWMEELPEAGTESAADLAARFRMGAAEVRAAAAVARVESDIAANGPEIGDLAGAACSTVARPRSPRFATLVKPRRTSGDLVLPETLHEQVTQIGTFYRNWPRVAEDWGLGRLAAGPGMRVLFTGEAGTGKTLAAEVIAAELELDLLKVDLARVVSKWVGETEKNLEASFEEAEGSASVLFFDEADSLFAKRGEVRHGTDRYANLEVGYLLQRLESFSGLVLLATNLRDNLDTAFTRRFNVILHFPRPALAERRRIWGLALPDTVPTADLDLDRLAKLEMTGASIVATAQTAALLAAEDGAAAITMDHAVRATARQFQREGRVLSRNDLSAHAALL